MDFVLDAQIQTDGTRHNGKDTAMSSLDQLRVSLPSG